MTAVSFVSCASSVRSARTIIDVRAVFPQAILILNVTESIILVVGSVQVRQSFVLIRSACPHAFASHLTLPHLLSDDSSPLWSVCASLSVVAQLTLAWRPGTRANPSLVSRRPDAVLCAVPQADLQPHHPSLRSPPHFFVRNLSRPPLPSVCACARAGPQVDVRLPQDHIRRWHLRRIRHATRRDGNHVEIRELVSPDQTRDSPERWLTTLVFVGGWMTRLDLLLIPSKRRAFATLKTGGLLVNGVSRPVRRTARVRQS